MKEGTLSLLWEFLDRRLKSLAGQKRVAVFDCDGTIIKGDIGESMLYYQLEHFLFRVSPATVWPDFPKRSMLNSLYEELCRVAEETRRSSRHFLPFAHLVLSWYFNQLRDGKTEKACADIVRLFTGFTLSEVRHIAQATMGSELASPLTQRKVGVHTLPTGIRFIRETVSVLRDLQRGGFELWVVSGSNQWSVEAVCKQLDLPSDRIIGIELAEIDGRLSSTVRTPVPVLEGKVKALKKRGVRRPHVVVSDSLYDIPLFMYSKTARVLVNSNGGSSRAFFSNGGIKKDDSWFVIGHPTLEG